jgi:hypothetical protein
MTPSLSAPGLEKNKFNTICTRPTITSNTAPSMAASPPNLRRFEDDIRDLLLDC